MLKFLKSKWWTLCLTLTISQMLIAQSTTIHNSYLSTTASNTTYEYSEYLYIGPNAVWEINGTHIIYSTHVWIAPTAQITGTGTLIFADPADNPYYPGTPSAPTLIDGNNGNFIELNIEHHNPANIVLGDIADPGYGTANPSGALSAALKIGKNFSFEVDNGDVLLNGNDFVFDENATHSNAGVNRMVVTGNSIDGHMVKENTSSTTFTFPVGIAEGDYTPAIIEGNNNYHVSVIDYAASTPTIEAPEEGMDRTWHVYGGTATSVALHHNSGGAMNTDGGDYTDADAFITRYLGSGQWTSGTAEQTATGVHTNTSAIGSGIPASGTADASYLTKTSDAVTPLPVKLISFDAYKKGSVAQLEWATASEQNNKGFEIERSTDGRTWTKIGFVKSLSESGNSNVKLDYSLIDNNPANGQNFYRLKQMDMDGKFEYSLVKTVTFEKANAISLYPNPAKDNVNIAGLQGGESIIIYDVSGRLMYQAKSENSNVNIPLNALSAGTYHISIIGTDGKVSSHKVVKN